MQERSPNGGTRHLRLTPFFSVSFSVSFSFSFSFSFFVAAPLAIALGSLACGPSATKTTPQPVTAGPGDKGFGDADPRDTSPGDTNLEADPPARLPTPTCDGARAPLHALRQARAGTIAQPGDVQGITALLAAIDSELGGERGQQLATELEASSGDTTKPPSVDALARVNALIALWLRDQLRRSVEVTVEAERNLAWARAECSWALLAADPDLMKSLEEERLGEIIGERLLAGRVVLLAEDSAVREGWDRVILPARQAIEKRLFTAAQRMLLREAAVAKANANANADSGASQRARAAFLLLRDRLQDKNSPAIAPIEAMLAGPPAAFDLPMLTDTLAITFAKRSRKYCSEVATRPELVGAATGLSSVTEGMTYSRLLLPDMDVRLSEAGFSGARYLETWDALLEEVGSGEDAGEIRRLSDELVRWNCAYQEVLGIAECTWNRDEVAPPAQPS